MLGVSITSNRYVKHLYLAISPCQHDSKSLTKPKKRQNWFPILLNILFLITIAIHGVVYSTKLPERVAYHYDAYVRLLRTHGALAERKKQNFFVFLSRNAFSDLLRVSTPGKARPIYSNAHVHCDLLGSSHLVDAWMHHFVNYFRDKLLRGVRRFKPPLPPSILIATLTNDLFKHSNCTSPEEASYPPAARRYLRLIVAGWALWLNLCVLGLVFTVFAVLLQNAVHSFDSATTFGVYLPFFVFCALLVVIIFWMFKRIQSAKKLIYSGFFNEHDADHPHLDSHEDEMIESKKLD